MKTINSLIVIFVVLFSQSAFAICVKNDTNFNLYYEIKNQNTRCPIPKVKFHSGTLIGQAKNCHAHSSAEGEDWTIYRKDLINVYQLDSAGNKTLVCSKEVTGILNTLDVDFVANRWWCLDRHDYQD